MRNLIPLLLVLCFFLACALVFLAGDAKAREAITAACVRDGHFEFRTHIYVCELDDESKARVFSRDANI